MSIRWYSIDRDLKIEEHESIGLDEALKVVDGYLARASEGIRDGEEAYAATTFGFFRTESEFIEICVNGPDKISYRFEAASPDTSWLRKLFVNVFRHEEELPSRRELALKVEEFFTTPIEEIKRRLESQ